MGGSYSGLCTDWLTMDHQRTLEAWWAMGLKGEVYDRLMAIHITTLINK